MTEELIKWFNNYFDNCYYVKHVDYPESIFMFYDINYARQLKLAKLEGIDYVEKTEVTGVCLFEQDWKNNFFRCNFIIIYCYLRDNYSFSYDDFQSFIKDRLEEQSKMNILKTALVAISTLVLLEEQSKMNILKPYVGGERISPMLEEQSKKNVLTPYGMERMIEEQSKMNVLTQLLSSTSLAPCCWKKK